MTDLPWLCPKCGFEWTYIMLKGDPLEYRKCEPCGLIMFNDTPPEYGE